MKDKPIIWKQNGLWCVGLTKTFFFTGLTIKEAWNNRILWLSKGEDYYDLI